LLNPKYIRVVLALLFGFGIGLGTVTIVQSCTPDEATAVEVATTETTPTVPATPTVEVYTMTSVKKYLVGKKVTDSLRKKVMTKYGIKLHIVKKKVTANKDVSTKVYKVNSTRSLVESGSVVDVSVYRYVNPDSDKSRGGHNLTKAECNETIQEYATEHHWSKARTRRIQRAAIDILWGPGAHESSGGAYTGSRSGCFGAFQFNTDWIGTTDKRSSVRWSTRRYCRVWDDGGEASVIQAWRATYQR
jgi:hypothetical protein